MDTDYAYRIVTITLDVVAVIESVLVLILIVRFVGAVPIAET